MARVVQAEAGGEIYEGKLAIIDGVRNHASGYKVGKTLPRLVEMVAREIKKPVRHKYRHWINFDIATDRRQILIARKAMKDGDGFWVGRHWFY